MIMVNSILEETTRSCTGCSACQIICPKNAISVKINKEGFYEAIINNDRCINCGICKTVCSRFVSSTSYSSIMQECPVAGMFSSDPNTQYSTTSGGLAFELSKWGIENNYKIFGVIYDYKEDEARGIIVDNIEELELLKGSKYLQANISDALSKLFEDAKEFTTNKYICFGTPCQIFGIRQLIRKKKIKNDFILVDLFCHGIPSYLVWKPYIKDIKSKTGFLNKINFRYKGNGWHQYTMRIEGNKKTYQDFACNDLFYRFFFDDVVLNKPCFNCDVRQTYTAADLRMGDFWGKEYEHREDGISAILIATEKGQYVIDKLLHEKRVLLDKYWKAEACLVAQSTSDYQNKELRNEVIKQLSIDIELSKVLRWYVSKQPLKIRIRSTLKRTIYKLPISLVIILRKLVRKV